MFQIHKTQNSTVKISHRKLSNIHFAFNCYSLQQQKEEALIYSYRKPLIKCHKCENCVWVTSLKKCSQMHPLMARHNVWKLHSSITIGWQLWNTLLSPYDSSNTEARLWTQMSWGYRLRHRFHLKTDFSGKKKKLFGYQMLLAVI